jgi:2'-phosphotransferase
MHCFNSSFKTYNENESCSLARGLLTNNVVIGRIHNDREVLIYLDVQNYLHDGMKIFIYEKKVILTWGFNGVVLPKYFKR